MIFRVGGRGRGRERNIGVRKTHQSAASHTCPYQAGESNLQSKYMPLIGYGTRDPPVFRLMPQPLSNTSQGYLHFKIKGFG